MSDNYPPGEAELVRWFRPPHTGAVERRDGESFADYFSRASIETHESQMGREAQARCGIAKIKADALREAAYEFAEGPWQDQWAADRVDDDVTAVQSTHKWFQEKADRIERGGGDQ